MSHSVYSSLQLSKAYKEHICFKELEEMMEFYECLSDSSYCFIHSGTKGITNYESYVFMSIQGTLDSIKQLLLIGRINDATILVRKFYDDILAEIYFSVTLKEKFDITKGLYVEEVQKWLESKYRVPTIKRILDIIRNSVYTKDLYPLFGWETYLQHNRQILDDCVHTNSYRNILFNCNTVYLDNNREKRLDSILTILTQLMTIQVAFVFHLNPVYMMASDYMDYIEMGIKPPVGSDCWISPYGQKAYDKYIKPNIKLAEFIKNNCFLNIE
ncbi:hypothetical protein [uncultured Prevotella sp.]|uniref:hypothetical protein n=1 Tax=uncultured Prevotella sp. TaxID=159272 RepID=UPI002629FA0E|nr:hypothetical protein [uncultured Prevotella sp.]